MSPNDPATRISEPSVSRYAFETHCCPARPPPRSSRIAGSATFTTVESTDTTAVPMIAAIRTRRLSLSTHRTLQRDRALLEDAVQRLLATDRQRAVEHRRFAERRDLDARGRGEPVG